MKKSINYAYPTSNNAKRLGYYKTGCFYVVFAEHITDLKPRLSKGFERLEDCKAFADTLPEEYQILCGNVLDGSRWKN